jgi:hypothetical protein
VLQLQLLQAQRMLQLDQQAMQPKEAAKAAGGKRDNNTIIKPIFTKFKKLIRRHKHLRQFFDYRLYKENKVSLVDFEKLFSFAELKGHLEELKELLNAEYVALLQPKSSYSEVRTSAYQEYIDRIFSSLNYANSYADRMTMLYANRKHQPQLEQVEEFRAALIKQTNLKVQ